MQSVSRLQSLLLRLDTAGCWQCSLRYNWCTSLTCLLLFVDVSLLYVWQQAPSSSHGNNRRRRKREGDSGEQSFSLGGYNFGLNLDDYNEREKPTNNYYKSLPGYSSSWESEGEDATLSTMSSTFQELLASESRYVNVSRTVLADQLDRGSADISQLMDDDDDDDDALDTKILSSFTAKRVYNFYAPPLHFICHYFYGKYFNYNHLVS